MSHSYIWEKSGLYRKFFENISGEEILESNFLIQADSKFSEIKYIINDFLDVKEYEIKTSHTKALAVSDNIISTEKGVLKIALIVNESGLIDLAQSYKQKMIDNMFKCEIFPSLQEARCWVSSV